MAEIQVRYPFNNSTTTITPAVSTFCSDYIKGNGILYTEENTTVGYSSSSSLYTFRITPSWMTTTRGLYVYIPNCNAPVSYQFKYTLRYPNSNSSGTLIEEIMLADTNFKTKDYTKIPFYNIETDNVSLFAIDNLRNYIMLVKRKKIDDPSFTSFSFMTSKHTDDTDNFPIGLYEISDQTSPASHIYSENEPFQSPNIGYMSSYRLYQYSRDGYIYPDIYYCDGGLSVPPDGICRIGPSKFLKLGSNFFLKID